MSEFKLVCPDCHRPMRTRLQGDRFLVGHCPACELVSMTTDDIETDRVKIWPKPMNVVVDMRGDGSIVIERREGRIR